MQIGAISLGWRGTPLPQVFEDLRAMGGTCVELNSRPGLHAGLVLDRQTIPQVRAWAEGAGVRISGVSGYNDFAQTAPSALDVEVERLLGACRLAAELGAGVVRAFVGDAKPGLTLEGAWPAVVTGLQRAAQLAEPLGVTLAVENHGTLVNDGAALAALVREVAAANVGLTLDTGNFCWAGRSLVQMQADVAASLPHVVNVHIKDGIWQDGAFEFVPAGEGALPLTEWLAALGRRGYSAAVCSEFEGSGDFLEGTRRSVAQLAAWVRS